MGEASDSDIAAAIERHVTALAALHARVHALDDAVHPGELRFAALEQSEMDALWSLVEMVPSTVSGYRAVARHMATYGPFETWPEGIAERLLRAFAGEPGVR
jgi:hypothetical protein